MMEIRNQCEDFRGDHNEKDKFTEKTVLNKEIEAYQKTFKQNTEFFSSYNPDLIEEALLKFIESKSSEPKIHKSKYKIKFNLESKNVNDETIIIELCARILKVNSTMVCVEFQKLGGDHLAFN